MKVSYKLAVALCACLILYSTDAITGKLPRIDGKRIVMIIASKNFRDEELKVPRAIFIKQGAKVVVACSSLKPARGMLGAVVKPDILLKSIDVRKFDAIVFVGGSGASEYWDDKTAHIIARQAVKYGKVLAAICIAPVILANAGILKGKLATVWASERRRIEAKGARYTAKSVQLHGKIVTANGPTAAKSFAEAIVRLLAKSVRKKSSSKHK